MSLTIKAIYENGVLKAVEPLPLDKHEKALVALSPFRRKRRTGQGGTARDGREKASRLGANYYASK